MILEAQFSGAARSDSVVVGRAVDHRAARTCHPDLVAVDGGVELAAALVFLVEGLNIFEQRHGQEATRGAMTRQCLRSHTPLVARSGAADGTIRVASPH